MLIEVQVADTITIVDGPYVENDDPLNNYRWFSYTDERVEIEHNYVEYLRLKFYADWQIFEA